MIEVKENYNRDRILELLGNIQLFSSLSGKELKQIIEKIELKKLRRQEVLLTEEETNQYMYVILEGKVKVVKATEDGKEIIIAMHQSGESFGELALIDNKTSPAMVLAAEHSTVAIISRKEFYSLLYSHGKILETVLQILCSRLRDSWGRIQLLSLNNASHRIRLLFVQLANEHGRRTADGMLLNIRLTHQDIADMTGVARETATRIIDKLLREGAIKVMRSKFVLLQHDLLNRDSVM